MPVPPPRIGFYSAADGARLAARVWDDGPATPKCRVVFLHGISSHGGWYHRSGEHLAARGHAVYFLDRRGSGLNVDRRGDVDRWHTWRDDVAAYLRGLPRDCPIVLCGISWGGKLAAAVARIHPDLICGLGLICPGFYSRYDASLWKRLLLTVPLPAQLAQWRASVPLRQATLFTDNPAHQDFIARDPLALRHVTLGFAKADCQLSRFARESAPFLDMPLLLMLAGRDRIVDNASTRRCCAGPHRTLIEYPRAAHTLEFESNPQTYLDDLANWIESVDSHQSTVSRQSSVAGNVSV